MSGTFFFNSESEPPTLVIRELANKIPSKLEGIVRIAVIATFTVSLTACTTLAPPSHQEISAKSTRAVVLDIDGTLTPDVYRIHAVRPDAAHAVRILAERGFGIVYLTARTPGFQSSIPDWLKKNGFPEGLVFAPQTMEEHRNPASFKTKILKELKQYGWEFAFAYGDSSTDFEAYENAGISSRSTFGLKRSGEGSCEPGDWAECFEDWSAHIGSLKDSLPTPVTSSKN